jgi:hypothetical protein
VSPIQSLVNLNRAAKNLRIFLRKVELEARVPVASWGMRLPWVDPRDPNYDSDREEDASRFK